MASHLESLRRALEDALDGASDSALSEAAAGKWNSGQILEHLFLTYRNTNRGVGKMPDERRAASHVQHA